LGNISGVVNVYLLTYTHGLVLFHFPMDDPFCFVQFSLKLWSPSQPYIILVKAYLYQQPAGLVWHLALYDVYFRMRTPWHWRICQKDFSSFSSCFSISKELNIFPNVRCILSIMKLAWGLYCVANLGVSPNVWHNSLKTFLNLLPLS
jgi:hypothetical protein